ncbi:MAG: hypothetical protein WCS30_00055 [Selenomonadaceae bacterium]
MQVLLNDKDITSKIKLINAEYKDRTCCQSDELYISKTSSYVEFKKNDAIEFVVNQISSGSMYISKIEEQRDMQDINCYAYPLKALSPITKTYEQITFMELLLEATKELGGYALQNISCVNAIYRRFDRIKLNTIGLLENLCLRESCDFKLFNHKIVITNDTIINSQPIVTIIPAEPPRFISDDSGLVRSVSVEYYDGDNVHKDKVASSCTYGTELYIDDVPVYSGGEAHRLATGIAYRRNRTEYTMSVCCDSNQRICAGNRMIIQGYETRGTFAVTEVCYSYSRKQLYCTGRRLV